MGVHADVYIMFIIKLSFLLVYTLSPQYNPNQQPQPQHACRHFECWNEMWCVLTHVPAIHVYQHPHAMAICTHCSHDAPFSSVRGMPFPNKYMKLYNASAHAVKAVHPTLRVGGPATMQLLDVVQFVQQASVMSHMRA